MELSRFKGVFAAAPTPFLKDGSVDVPTAERLTNYYIDNGICGIFALSSTGEYFAMGHKQRADLVEATVKAAAGRVPVLAAASDACLEIVKENTRRLAAQGVDGVVITPPYYFKYSQDELYRFFTEAADFSPVPVLLYNQPMRLASAISEELAQQLADHPNIVGLKDTSDSAPRLEKMAAFAKDRDDFTYFVGSESLAAYGALNGANYVYALASIEPKLFVDMLEMGKKGDVAGVLNAQKRVVHLCKLFRIMGGGSAESFTNFAAAIKAALECKGFGQAYTAQIGRLPTEQEYAAIRQIVEQ